MHADTHIRCIFRVYALYMHLCQVFRLENAEFYAEIFLWILTEVVDQFRTFARELVEVRSGLIDVVEERLVRDELSKCAFT